MTEVPTSGIKVCGVDFFGMTSPKRHHIVPRFLLERFCRNGILWVYDRERNAFRGQQPSATAVMRDYYTFRDAGGERRTDVEEALSGVESAAKPVIDRLASREPLTADQRSALATFLALLNTRVPHFARGLEEIAAGLATRLGLEAFATPARARASIEHCEQQTGKSLGVTPEEMVEYVHDPSYGTTVALPAASRLGDMWAIAHEIAPLLTQFQWLLLHPPTNKSFVTTDSPFTLMVPPAQASSFYGAGLLTPGTLKFIALAADLGLMMRDPGVGEVHLDIPEAYVRELNLAVTVRAESYVFSRDERLLRNVVLTTRLATRPRNPRMRVS